MTPNARGKPRRSAKHGGYPQAELVGVGLTKWLGYENSPSFSAFKATRQHRRPFFLAHGWPVYGLFDLKNTIYQIHIYGSRGELGLALLQLS